MTDQPTTDRLAEIRGRLDAATPGPWTRFGREIGNEDGDSWFLGHDIQGPPEAERGQFERVADAELIAHAPADLEHLLSLVDSLQARLDTAEGQLAHFAAQHQPYDNMFRTCRTCKDGYGEPLAWPCEDALRLNLVGNCPDCAAPTLRRVDRECPKCDAGLGLGVSQ